MEQTCDIVKAEFLAKNITGGRRSAARRFAVHTSHTAVFNVCCSFLLWQERNRDTILHLLEHRLTFKKTHTAAARKGMAIYRRSKEGI